MKKLEEDIKNAIDIIKNGNGSTMNSYCKIYQNTTENLKAYMPLLEGDYKSALLPTSSGDHLLEAILNGITNVTCFDINHLARYFAELKFAAIKNFSKDEYINFMYKNTLNREMFEFLKNSLENDVSIFWKELFAHSDINRIKHNLFFSVGLIDKNKKIINGADFYEYSASHFTRYMDDDNYNIVQNRLQNTKINYIESDILDLPQTLENSYDLINLTNIYEYVNDKIFDDSAKEFADTVRKLITYLNNDGKMLIDYKYECGVKDINKYKNKTIFYALLLWAIQCSRLSLSYFNTMANYYGRKNIMDKLNDFRTFQYLKYLDDINIELHEIEGSGTACRYFSYSNTDMALIYTKNQKKL